MILLDEPRLDPVCQRDEIVQICNETTVARVPRLPITHTRSSTHLFHGHHSMDELPPDKKHGSHARDEKELPKLDDERAESGAHTAPEVYPKRLGLVVRI